MDAIRRFSSNLYADGLESWSFLKLKRKTPLFCSPFGDLFLEARDGIWFLDTVDGTLRLICSSAAELQDLLNTPEGQDEYLMLALAQAADDAGIRPQQGEVYDFVVAPALGAPIEVSNVTTLDFVVKLNLAGQVHAQLRKLAPGATISGITINP